MKREEVRIDPTPQGIGNEGGAGDGSAASRLHPGLSHHRQLALRRYRALHRARIHADLQVGGPTTCPASPEWVIANMDALFDSYSYWTFSDVFEENGVSSARRRHHRGALVQPLSRRCQRVERRHERRHGLRREWRRRVTRGDFLRRPPVVRRFCGDTGSQRRSRDRLSDVEGARAVALSVGGADGRHFSRAVPAATGVPAPTREGDVKS
jgi:hypothetical protein